MSAETSIETRKQAADSLIAAVQDAQLMAETGNSLPNRISAENMGQFKMALEKMGVTSRVLSAEDLHLGIEHAKTAITSGEAKQWLAGQQFIGETERQNLYNSSVRNLIETEEPIYINPSCIQGVEGFDSWMGRGVEGGEEVADRQTGVRRSSLETIFDYASRDTQIPGIESDGDLAVILSEEGPVLLATNAHRVAAAKLRGEPLRVTNFDIRTPKQLTQQ